MSKMSELHYERELSDAISSGPENPTICKLCDNVCASTRKQEPWKWRCMMVPIHPGFGFVDPDFSPTPPYEACSRVNRNGNCEWFTPLRIAEKGNENADD